MALKAMHFVVDLVVVVAAIAGGYVVGSQQGFKRGAQFVEAGFMIACGSSMPSDPILRFADFCSYYPGMFRSH